MKQYSSVAVLAHVDAGKTTLSEAMLYTCGSIRKLGRVDNGDTFLDTDAMERARGITIFSKQAVLPLHDMEVTLLDTPGHVDFSAEMERTLQVSDYAILVVSAADGVQGHTITLWHLLKRYEIPVFVFVNKMDQPGCGRESVLRELQKELDGNFVDFGTEGSDAFYEQAAVSDEKALEIYLETGKLSSELLQELIAERKLTPCYFGSALKMQGVEELLEGMYRYMMQPVYPETFGARVYKIGRDEQGSRITYLKMTGGTLTVKELIGEEKVNQIRRYSGEKYETLQRAEAGMICGIIGPAATKPGDGLGCEETALLPFLTPVLNYRLLLPDDMDAARMLPKLRELEEEEPELHLVWNEALQEIQIQVMGEVQIEILTALIKERFGVEVSFGEGNIVYRETIAAPVEGVGHFEPLRHYAEVHLLLEPLEPGSGLEFAACCSTDVLNRNWQRLILTHLEEREHIGVLTGSPITDMRITLIAGRAHQKHTEGGDFRQATYRAVRQGLRRAESVLLEPWYNFKLTVPEEMLGRAMTDIKLRCGTMEAPVRDKNQMILTGSAPVECMRNYQKELTAYTKGTGRILCTLAGYRPCHNTEEVVAKIGYDADADLANPCGSVFCAHGAGFVVEWNQVADYMHLESPLSGDASASGAKSAGQEMDAAGIRYPAKEHEEEWIGTDEIDAILERTYHANRKGEMMRGKNGWKLSGGKTSQMPVTRTYKPIPKAEEYLLVDGYNIIFAWEELRGLAAVNIDSARGRLLDLMCNYQGSRGCKLLVVFDAYRVQGHETETFSYHNIQVVYTKEAETADQFIEKFAHENAAKYRVTVATSDGLEQIIIRGAGCLLLSARDLEEEIRRQNENSKASFEQKNESGGRNYLLDSVSKETMKQLKDLGREMEES